MRNDWIIIPIKTCKAVRDGLILYELLEIKTDKCQMKNRERTVTQATVCHSPE